MSDTKTVVVLQRELQAAEAERLRLVGELDAMRERAEAAEARLASISGATREELVAAEQAKRADLLAALKGVLHAHVPRNCHCPACVLGRAAIAKAEQT